jgi:arylsulfatase A-like enzyme
MPRNKVLICLDTVRKDHFDSHTSELQRISQLSFDQCRAASALSVPSQASLMTGKLPHQHGIHSFNRKFTGLSQNYTFLGDLPDHRSIGVSANVYASSAFGFDSIFDEFVDIASTHRFPDGLDVRKFGFDCEAEGVSYSNLLAEALSHDHTLKSIGTELLSKLYHFSRELPLPALLDDGANIASRTALRQIAGSEEPGFLFINYMDAHGPLQHVRCYDRNLHSVSNDWCSSDSHDWKVMQNGDESYLENYRALYGASIDYLDRTVLSFIQEAKNRLEGETTFVITADQGENLGYRSDKGLLNHTSSLTEGLLHVPLVVVDPPERYDSFSNRFVSNLDIGRLIRDLTKGTISDISRESIPAEVIGKTDGVDVRDDHEWWNRTVRSVYEDDTNHVWDSLGNETRYRIAPGAQNRQKKLCESISVTPDEHFCKNIDQCREHAVSDSETADVSDGTTARLEDLGYL